jgi:hypothetical protein
VPRQYVDTTADGTATDWTVNFASSGWEAVLRSSGDSSYISSSTLGHQYSFVCGDGTFPVRGFVTGIVIHYRVRQTVAGAGADVGVTLSHGAAVSPPGPAVALTNSWTTLVYRYRVDWVSGVRFSRSDVQDLGFVIEVLTAPSSGEVQCSEAWVEVEYTTMPEFYDPAGLVLPNAIVGDLTWSTSGGQSAALLADYLYMSDSSAVDWVNFYRTIPEFGSDFVTEVQTALIIIPPINNECNLYIASVEDGSRSIHLTLVTDASGTYVGLTGEGLDHDDVSSYLDLTVSDPGGTSYYTYTLRIDRSTPPDPIGVVEVFTDFDFSSPVLSVPYTSFPSTTNTQLLFGTGEATFFTSTTDAVLDYISWESKKKNHTFPKWETIYTGSNSVQADTTDYDIVKFFNIPVANILAGQCDSCCKLVVADPAETCEVFSYWQFLEAAPTTYEVAVDYKMDVFGTEAELLIQRTSDYYYWNQGGSAWQAASSTITLANSMTRTRVTAVMDTISVPTIPENLIIRVRRKTAAGPSYNVYLYKVKLEEM